MTMNNNTIILRAHAAVRDEQAAKVIEKTIASVLVMHAQIVRSHAIRYWKMDGYFEIFFELKPVNEITKDFLNILDALGTGWEAHLFDDGDDWAVWNPGPESSFIPSEIRWANLECLQKAE